MVFFFTECMLSDIKKKKHYALSMKISIRNISYLFFLFSLSAMNKNRTRSEGEEDGKGSDRKQKKEGIVAEKEGKYR